MSDFGAQILAAFWVGFQHLLVYLVLFRITNANVNFGIKTFFFCFSHNKSLHKTVIQYHRSWPRLKCPNVVDTGRSYYNLSVCFKVCVYLQSSHEFSITAEPLLKTLTVFERGIQVCSFRLCILSHCCSLASKMRFTIVVRQRVFTQYHQFDGFLVLVCSRNY